MVLAASVRGDTGRWLAILADTGASMLVTLNTLRFPRFDICREF